MRGRAALILKRRNATGEVYPFLGPGFALRCRYCRWPGAWPLSPSHTLPLTLTYRLGGKFHCKAVDFFPAGFCIGAFPPQKHCKKDISTTKERQNMIIGIDHGYYAIKTRHCSFPAGLTCYGRAVHAAECAGGGRTVLRLRHGAPAGALRQDRERHLLPADARGVGTGNQNARRTKREFG